MKFTLFLFGFFYIVTLFNPVFKKYDYGAEFPMVILFTIVLLSLLIINWKRKEEKSPIEKGSLFLFAGWIVLSFVFSDTKNIGFSEVLAFLSAIALYLLFAFRKIPWKESFVEIIRYIGLFAAILGFILYFSWPEVRMVGPFFNILNHSNVWPNAFALFLLMVWPLFINGTYSKAYLRPIFISIILAALFLTYSRGASIVLAGQVLLLITFFYKKYNSKVFISTILTIVFTATLFYGANYARSFKYEVVDIKEKVSFGNNEGLTSKQERVDFWKGALDIMKEEPLFGTGPFSFRYAYNPDQKSLLANSDHPHNLFLKIGSENGILALIFFGLFLISFISTVFSRIKDLELKDRVMVYILLTSIAGAFAHSLIDYNFNFLANLILLFTFMAFVRSYVAKKESIKNYFILPFILMLTVLALYEGSLLVLSKFKDPSYLQYSVYPRNYYLGRAEKAINEKNYEAALKVLEKQTHLNKLDAQGFYLKGVAECAMINECTENFKKAIELNPLNDFSYYRDYLRTAEDQEIQDRAYELIKTYFVYVENNVHFTAYTGNVEAAAELIDILAPRMAESAARELLVGKVKMLETAEKLRKDKTF